MDGVDLLKLLGQAGPIAVFCVAIVLGFKQGWIRTAQEVEAWKERALRAEVQVDTLVPAVAKLTEITNRILDTLERRR